MRPEIPLFACDADVGAYFSEQGFAAIGGLLAAEEVELYRQIFERFSTGQIQVGAHRSDC